MTMNPSILWLLMLACSGPSTEADRVPSEPAAKAKASPSSAARTAGVPVPAGTTLPTPETGLAPGSPKPVATLDLEHARTGMNVPNAVKGMAVAWDGAHDTLWHAGIFSTWLLGHDAETGAVLRAVDIEVDGFNPSRMYVDQARHRLVWVNSRKEQVRVVDLENDTLARKIDVQGGRGRQSYPTSENALDRMDGRVWVWNGNARTLTGYDPGGGASKSITGMSQVFALSAAPSGGKIGVLDTQSRDQARIVVVDTRTMASRDACTFTSRPPRNFWLGDDGTMILGGDTLQRVDANCQVKWSVDLGESPMAIDVDDGTIVATLAAGADDQGGVSGQVALVDLASGALRSRVAARYEPEFIGMDTKGHRAFVGNAGDGSVTVVPLPDGQGTKHLAMASSADDVTFDPVSGDRFVLSRLGGSRIWRWKKDGSASIFAADCPWPFALGIDPDRRLLLAPSYFESKLYAWPLDGGAPKVIDLKIPGSTGDSLGDFSYDPTTGLAAVIQPAEGWVSVVDVAKARVRFTKRFETIDVGTKAGPGKAQVAVAGGAIYVASPVVAQIWKLDPINGAVLAQGDLPSTESQGGQRGVGRPGGRSGPPGAAGRAGGRPGGRGGPPGVEGRAGGRPGGRSGPPGAAGRTGGRPGGRGGPPGAAGRAGGHPGGRGGSTGAGQSEHGAPGAARGAGGGRKHASRGNLYGFGLFYYDAVHNRLFYGSHVLDPDALTVTGELPENVKAVWSDTHELLTLSAADNLDTVQVRDPETLQVLHSFPALSSPMTHAEVIFDSASRTIYLSDLPRARVTAFSVPAP